MPINKHHIYLVKNDRTSMPGVNSKNVEYLAHAIKDALENVK
jgi:aspartate/tyrosine/aromatic aminotransferase